MAVQQALQPEVQRIPMLELGTTETFSVTRSKYNNTTAACITNFSLNTMIKNTLFYIACMLEIIHLNITVLFQIQLHLLNTNIIIVPQFIHKYIIK